MIAIRAQSWAEIGPGDSRRSEQVMESAPERAQNPPTAAEGKGATRRVSSEYVDQMTAAPRAGR
jgi:hypothetical protein